MVTTLSIAGRQWKNEQISKPGKKLKLLPF